MNALISNISAFVEGHPLLAVLVVFLVAAGEAIFVIGLFVPSTAVLLAAGALIGLGQLSFWPIFIAACLGATAGDGVSYWAGHIYKGRLVRLWPFSHYPRVIESGERFFLLHGGKSIFIGRFVPGIKAVVPGIAGMMGMSVGRFTVINVISAVAWSAAHLLPGMGFGRGIAVSGAGNPRLIALIVISVVSILVVWYAVKIAIVWFGPRFIHLHQVLVRRLELSSSGPMIFFHRLLINEGQILSPLVWGAIGLLSFAGFAGLVIDLLFQPQLFAADHAISNFVQSFRNVPADEAMVAITMIGDSPILAVAAIVLITGLVAYRRWKAGIAVLVGVLSTVAFVPVMKMVLQRPRPIDLYTGAEAFSFPSGHATLSATVFGLIAVIAAQGRSRRVQTAIYSVTATIVGAIALSRIYLAAHWPSDLAAGLLFGAALVSLVAFFIYRTPPFPSGRIIAVLGIAVVLAYPIYFSNSYAAWASAYAPRSEVKTTGQSGWMSQGWQALPKRRILFDGETGEPFVVQTDVSASNLIDRLNAAGWRSFAVPSFADQLSIIVPTRLAFADLTPLPSFHDGRAPVLILTKAADNDPDRRFVLRFWVSGTEVEHTGSSAPVENGGAKVCHGSGGIISPRPA